MISATSTIAATRKHLSSVVILTGILLGSAGFWLTGSNAGNADRPVYTLAAYGTDLSMRTPHQRYNARRAAAAIDGKIVKPGGVFSFNQTVRGWSADRGFLKAPVSYDGVLIDDFGGGVCQTSTTLYNAALLAGMVVLERHQHTFAPGYAPAGQDAAVAYSGVDLRFRNPFPHPVVIHAKQEGSHLVCSIQCESPPTLQCEIRRRIVSVTPPPPPKVDPTPGNQRARWRAQGKDGVRVIVIRTTSNANGRQTQEEISDNTYLPMAGRW